MAKEESYGSDQKKRGFGYTKDGWGVH